MVVLEHVKFSEVWSFMSPDIGSWGARSFHKWPGQCKSARPTYHSEFQHFRQSSCRTIAQKGHTSFIYLPLGVEITPSLRWKTFTLNVLFHNKSSLNPQCPVTVVSRCVFSSWHHIWLHLTSTSNNRHFYYTPQTHKCLLRHFSITVQELRCT